MVQAARVVWLALAAPVAWLALAAPEPPTPTSPLLDNELTCRTTRKLRFAGFAFNGPLAANGPDVCAAVRNFGRQ